MVHDDIIAARTYYTQSQMGTQGMGTRPREVYDALGNKILNDNYPCVGAKAAWNGNQLRAGLYFKMGDDNSSEHLAEDLRTFSNEVQSSNDEFLTFIAVFDHHINSEVQFEMLLWKQLQALHDIENNTKGWDQSVSSDPQSDKFSFSFNETAFFIVGMHYHASRKARKFPYPAMAFNLHSQFENLRDTGRYEPMKSVIRDKEVALQGSINPMLADFGKGSEAAQYSGRKVSDSWKCPFHP